MTIACSTLSQKVGEGNALSDVPHWLPAGSRTGPVAPSLAGPWGAWRVLPCANARWPCTPQPSRYQGLQVLTGIGRPQRPAPTRQSSHSRRDGRLTRRCRAAIVGLLRDFGGSAWTLAPGGSAGLFGQAVPGRDAWNSWAQSRSASCVRWPSSASTPPSASYGPSPCTAQLQPEMTDLERLLRCSCQAEVFDTRQSRPITARVCNWASPNSVGH